MRQRILVIKKTLEGVARDLRVRGKGKLPNRSRSLTIENEELLWKHDQFGMKTPRSLLQTVWWFVSQHFGIRGRSEHHQLKLKTSVLKQKTGVNK